LRSIAWCAVALAVACGETAKTQSGPLDRIYRPTGLAVESGRLLVASSNGDLLYDDDTGGSLIALDPSVDPAHIPTGGAVNLRSFAGDLVIARNVVQDPAAPEPDACGTALATTLAITATRGSNTLNTLSVAADGRLSCERCGTPLSGTFGDPFAVAVACGPGRASAFVGYLHAPDAGAWLTEYDLVTGALRTVRAGIGPVRAFAYDAARDRLYFVGLATGVPTPLRWIELGGCTLGLAAGSGGCSVGSASLSPLPPGIELRSIALAHPLAGAPQRAYLTGRLYDVASAATAGGRTTEFGGLLIVVDFVENARGGVDAQVVRRMPLEGDLGHGLQDVRVLPARPGKRDVVATVAIDDGVLWIYDDETLSLAAFGRGGTTGAPTLGHQPFGLAVDPVAVGTAARLYVGSYGENYVTPIEVPLDAPDRAVFAGGTQRKITGGTP